MSRITISLTHEIEELLREIQGGLIQNKRQDISFTTVINFVLLSGIISTDEFTDNTWLDIQKFIDDKKIKINSKNAIDEFIKRLK